MLLTRHFDNSSSDTAVLTVPIHSSRASNSCQTSSCECHEKKKTPQHGQPNYLPKQNRTPQLSFQEISINRANLRPDWTKKAAFVYVCILLKVLCQIRTFRRSSSRWLPWKPLLQKEEVILNKPLARVIKRKMATCNDSPEREEKKYFEKKQHSCNKFPQRERESRNSNFFSHKLWEKS